jgi:hypothetical protein
VSDPSGVSPVLVLALMAAGVLLGIGGHIAKSNKTVAAGLIILFLATALMILGGFLDFSQDGTDPRPGRNPQEPAF